MEKELDSVEILNSIAYLKENTFDEGTRTILVPLDSILDALTPGWDDSEEARDAFVSAVKIKETQFWDKYF
jgi:hypothetical protein